MSPPGATDPSPRLLGLPVGLLLPGRRRLPALRGLPVGRWLPVVRRLFLLVALLALVSVARPAPAQASSGAVTLVPERTEVLEVLRLAVPAEGRACWRRAEAEAWEPWLAQRRGYRGRELYWDPERQEALLIIGWARRADWKRIPQTSLDAVQERFEQAARRCLGAQETPAADRVQPANPFPIVSSGELLHERLSGAGADAAAGTASPAETAAGVELEEPAP